MLFAIGDNLVNLCAISSIEWLACAGDCASRVLHVYTGCNSIEIDPQQLPELLEAIEQAICK